MSKGPLIPDEAIDTATVPVTVSDADKLRIIRDIVEGQAPFGSELANFQRRLRLILDLR
jgi:hypothetical protein